MKTTANAKIIAIKCVTITQVLEAIKKAHPRVDDRNFDEDRFYGNSFADRGAKRRFVIARRLYLRITEDGYRPSVKEVVGYFGKGARLASEN